MLLDLLPEIRDFIFSYCGTKDLKNVSLSSRECSRIVKKALFRQVTIPKKHLLDIDLTDHDHLDNLQYTKKLYVCGDVARRHYNPYESKIKSCNFKKILSQCNLHVLEARYVPVDGFEYICKQMNLKELDLYGTDFRSFDIHMICDHLTNLKALNLISTNLTDEGLQRIHKLARLEQLFLACCDITDVGVAYLSPLVNLKVLDISSCLKVTDTAMTSLSHLVRLQGLNLSFNLLYDDGLVNLGSLNHLKTLKLAMTNITDLSFVYLCRLPCLEGLNVNETLVTDSGLKFLRECKTLKRLDCWFTYVTTGGMEDLNKERKEKIHVSSQVQLKHIDVSTQ